MRKIIAVLLALCLASGALPVLSEGAGGSILTMLQNKFKTDLSVQQDPEPEEAPDRWTPPTFSSRPWPAERSTA